MLGVVKGETDLKLFMCGRYGQKGNIYALPPKAANGDAQAVYGDIQKELRVNPF